MMIRMVAVAVGLAALASCTTPEQDRAAYRPQLLNYYACVMTRAKNYGLTDRSSPPLDIVLAAENKCLGERLAAQDAYFSVDKSIYNARRFNVLADTRDMMVGSVVEARIKAGG